MGKIIDLVGKVFSRLTVVSMCDREQGKRISWVCKCICGNVVNVSGDSLKQGATKSCGCLHKELIGLYNKKYNTYDLSGEYGIGYTTEGEEFYFDLEDYDKIKKYYWRRNKSQHVTSYGSGYEVQNIRQHRLIKDVIDKNDVIIDHINCIPYDNRKKNLRYATKQENNMNKGANKNNKLGIKGVYKARNKYWAYITKDYKKIHIGVFCSLEEAMFARNQKEIELFGEFAYKGVEIPNE
jgi:hypothetical protein